MYDPMIESPRRDVLARELQSRTPSEGVTPLSWPGLAVCRLDRPQPLRWDGMYSPSFCFVVQGRQDVLIEDVEYECSADIGVALDRGAHNQINVVEASAENPYLAVLLEIDSSIVRRVGTDVLIGGGTSGGGAGSEPILGGSPTFRIERPLTSALLRFLRALDGGLDQQVLAPICLQELVYRLFQLDPCRLVLESASRELDTDPVRVAVQYIREHLTEAITITDIARAVRLSPSAFAHAFRSTIGISPYQFLKMARLDAARRMLLAQDAVSVTEVARAVGYSSSSHFITEFKRRYMVTPGGYAGTVGARSSSTTTRLAYSVELARI